MVNINPKLDGQNFLTTKYMGLSYMDKNLFLPPHYGSERAKILHTDLSMLHWAKLALALSGPIFDEKLLYLSSWTKIQKSVSWFFANKLRSLCVKFEPTCLIDFFAIFCLYFFWEKWVISLVFNFTSIYMQVQAQEIASLSHSLIADN